MAIRINKEISELLTETKKVQLKTSIKHPIKVKSCKIIQYYSFNNNTIKVCFDSEETKSLIHQKYKHLDIDNTNNYGVEYKIFNSDNKLFIFKNNKIVGSWDSSRLHEFQGKFSMELICSFYNKTELD